MCCCYQLHILGIWSMHTYFSSQKERGISRPGVPHFFGKLLTFNISLPFECMAILTKSVMGLINADEFLRLPFRMVNSPKQNDGNPDLECWSSALCWQMFQPLFRELPKQIFIWWWVDHNLLFLGQAHHDNLYHSTELYLFLTTSSHRLDSKGLHCMPIYCDAGLDREFLSCLLWYDDRQNLSQGRAQQHK